MVQAINVLLPYLIARFRLAINVPFYHAVSQCPFSELVVIKLQ
jgi:hypothetical protein